MVITGAAGFLGRAVTRAALVGGHGVPLRLVDRVAAPCDDSRAEIVVADIADGTALRRALKDATQVIHLAAVPGGAAEQDPVLSRSINLDATMNLLQALEGKPVRLVYASSIAVLGSNLPVVVDDNTSPQPDMTYGTHKRMCELALSDGVRRGRLDAIALRLPGIVARPRAGAGFRSAFLSDLFWQLQCGESITIPVRAEATTWLLSSRACVRNLLHALNVRSAHSVLNLPAVRVTMLDLIAAVIRHLGTRSSAIRYEPDSALEARFAAYPPLVARAAEALGFEPDASLAALVGAAFEEAA